MSNLNHTEEFLALQGHEMRNSLSALRHALDLWAMRDPGLMDDLRHIMERQVRQLTRLSDDFLDIARIEQGELEFRSEQVCLQTVVDDACEEVRPFIDRCAQKLRIKSPDDPIVVYGDPTQLVQVFTNLLQNATKFTGRKGTICVSVALQEESAEEQDCDNGPGIEQNLLPVMFEAGSQPNGNRVTEQVGLGIGLKLVKAYGESHDGRVAVQSGGLGQGSKFTIVLPLGDGEAHADRPVHLPHFASKRVIDGPPLPAYRIVIVNVNRELGELLARLLRTIGQSVTVATNGMTAIELILQNRPQVVFLDLMMSEHVGYAVACELRRHAELDGVALVALSGFGDEQHKRRAQDVGCDMFLVKPFGLLDFANVLDQVSSIGRARI